MEPPSPRPRRVGRPSWLDLRLAVGVLLVIGSVLLGATLISRARHTDRHLAVTHDLAAGATLRASDLRTVDVQLDDGQGALYLGAGDDDRAIGKVLSRPLAAGELLPADALTSEPARTTVNVPLAEDAAPKLTRGERIVLWLSTPACRSVVLLPDVVVQDVRASDSAGFAAQGGQQVVLSIAPDFADRVELALAIDHATIRAGVLTGSPTGPASSAVSASASALPDLGSCSTTPTP